MRHLSLIRRHSPTAPRSPTYRYQPDYHPQDGPGFSDTVSNVVEIQRYTHYPHSTFNNRHRPRGELLMSNDIEKKNIGKKESLLSSHVFFFCCV